LVLVKFQTIKRKRRRENKKKIERKEGGRKGGKDRRKDEKTKGRKERERERKREMVASVEKKKPARKRSGCAVMAQPTQDIFIVIHYTPQITTNHVKV
jgi:hypothetical protein